MLTRKLNSYGCFFAVKVTPLFSVVHVKFCFPGGGEEAMSEKEIYVNAKCENLSKVWPSHAPIRSPGSECL